MAASLLLLLPEELLLAQALLLLARAPGLLLREAQLLRGATLPRRLETACKRAERSPLE